jgi:uncharacterized protein YjbJ (UPF0337 family)
MCVSVPTSQLFTAKLNRSISQASRKFADRDAAAAEVRMSKRIMPSVDEMKGKWKQNVGAAKLAWGKLTEDELLKFEGRQDKLAGAIQERYAITRDEADRQVKDFFAKLAP